MPKVVLGFSGGLHTTVCTHWLRHEKNMRVIAVAIDLGQKQSLRDEADRAIAAGAESVHIIDVREVFVKDFILKALKANARTQSGYLLTSAIARPLISRELVKIAREEDCRFIAHGARGNRNDHVRFRNCISAIAPEMTIIAPLNEWRMKTREEEVNYAKQYGIPIDPGRPTFVGCDRNLWGAVIRCNELGETWSDAPPDLPYRLTANPEDAPDRPEHVEIEFERGLPAALNGQPMKPLNLIDALNTIGGEHGVGRLYAVEETLAGTRNRNVYEAPAATILYAAHEALELLVMRRLLVRYKELLGRKYADLIFRGQWFDEFRDCLDAFFDKSQAHVTGSVRLKLYKGNCIVTGRKSEFSLFAAAPETAEQVEA